MKTLEQKLKQLLTELDPEATFTLWAHELWRDDVGWSSNDRWKILTEGDLEEALRSARSRWEVFKENYDSKARVFDIERGDYYNHHFSLECGCLPFLDVEVHPRDWSVTVGNLGNVYLGQDYTEAKESFDEYVRQSIDNYGRAGNESVTLWCDNEPYEEFRVTDYFTSEPARAYQKCWAHHPRGGRTIGYATRVRDGIYGKERGILPTKEESLRNEGGHSVPASQVMWIDESAAGVEKPRKLKERVGDFDYCKSKLYFLRTSPTFKAYLAKCDEIRATEGYQRLGLYHKTQLDMMMTQCSPSLATDYSTGIRGWPGNPVRFAYRIERGYALYNGDGKTHTIIEPGTGKILETSADSSPIYKEIHDNNLQGVNVWVGCPFDKSLTGKEY